jgi:hypothetical protein
MQSLFKDNHTRKGDDSASLASQTD